MDVGCSFTVNSHSDHFFISQTKLILLFLTS
ncbi:hypothetical protein T01_9121 [Trichinella spiralis]|uniref:Uncharacterized protein n=1 Tax=Trichinella spiralis TaxID=6334 RepID=A0A0V0YU17_TRISP|nr:hypothetical protein T01_9121 [Trichinella spiralis]